LTQSEKIEKFDVFRGNIKNPYPNHKWLPQPRPQKIDLTPARGQKFLTPDPSLQIPGSKLFH